MIIPVFKDNCSSRFEAKNYRPIILLSCIYKLFEKVLHELFNRWIGDEQISFHNKQQNAYPKQRGAVTASFNLQETIYRNRELKSKVYVCLLDTQQAFDTVWLNGEFKKLHDLGITGKMWILLVDAHTNMTSCVSTQFSLKYNKIRQGGVISTWIYRLFIDELLNQLESSQVGPYVLNNATGNTTLADDFAHFHHSACNKC